MSSWLIKVVFAVALIACLPALARAQALFPHSYTLSCTGMTGAGNSLSLVGELWASSAVTGQGAAQFVNGPIILFTTFTAKFTNGTANSVGAGGNGIPAGCFRGSAIFSGDSFGVLDGFFGCYNDTTHGFSLTQTSSSLGTGTTLTCQGKEM